jgi:hypothetical protein
MSNIKEGVGSKKPQLDIHIERLHLDPENPRLPRSYQGKSQELITEALYKFFNLEELANSMAENAYFDAEPLVVIPKSLPIKFTSIESKILKGEREYNEFLNHPSTEFIVVEGNRRLSTAKLLVSRSKKRFPIVEDQEILDDLKILPCIIYARREDVLAYLGARHIIGTRKWDAYAKARYIASLHENHGLSIDDIQRTVGDTANSVRKTFASYKLIEKIEENFDDIDARSAKEKFSLLMLATGQGPIKEYIGLPRGWNNVDFDEVIPDEKLIKFKNLFTWIFGDGNKLAPLIQESRDITSYLSKVLHNKDATIHLEENRNLHDAYERSDGEKELIIAFLRKSNVFMQKSFQLLYKFEDDEDVQSKLEELQKTFEQLAKYSK